MDESPDEYAWMLRARCRGANPMQFLPSNSPGVEAAQRICAECAVRVECLEYALAHEIKHGVWGGVSQRERQRMLRLRSLGSRAPQTYEQARTR